jgi:Na+/proline symporter
MVRISRVLVLVLTIVALILGFLNPIGIIKIIEFALSGFACMLAPVLGALYWKRCTSQAALWSVVGSQVCLWGLELGFLPASWKFGFLAGLPAIVVGVVILVAVTYMTPAPQDEGTREYFALFDKTEPETVGN